MSSEVKEKETVKIKPSEGFLSKRRKKILIDPLDDNNPISIQVLVNILYQILYLNHQKNIKRYKKQ